MVHEEDRTCSRPLPSGSTSRVSAFCVAEPLPPPGDGDVLVRTLHTGMSRGTETSVFGGRVPASEHERMRAPFQEGDFPGPGEVRLPECRRRRAGTARAARPHGLHPLPPPVRLRRARPMRSSRARRRAGPSRRARRRGRDRGQRAVGCRPARRRPGHGRRRRDDRMLHRATGSRHPRGRGRARRRRPVAARRGRPARRRLRRAGRAPRRPRPRHQHERVGCRAAARARDRRDRGRGDRGQLVRATARRR